VKREETHTTKEIRMSLITLNISSIEKMDAADVAAYYRSPFGLYSRTQEWTWEGGGFAILGITPARGPMESYVFWRMAEGEAIRSRVFLGGGGIGPLLKSYGFDSVVADPNPGYVYPDSTPAETMETLMGR
jgi:hypothetical protein